MRNEVVLSDIFFFFYLLLVKCAAICCNEPLLFSTIRFFLLLFGMKNKTHYLELVLLNRIGFQASRFDFILFVKYLRMLKRFSLFILALINLFDHFTPAGEKITRESTRF